MGYGEALKQELKRQGRTVSWLSRETGVNHSTLYAIMRRDVNTTKFARLINDAMGVNLYTSTQYEETEPIKPASITITIEGALIDELMKYVLGRSQNRK